MTPVPPDSPGSDNDLKDKVEDAVVKAMAEPGSVEYPDDRWRAFFFAFQSQTFDTDDNGNPRKGARTLGALKGIPKRRTRSKRRGA